MLRELLREKPEPNCTFQTMLLNNDSTGEVEVHEAQYVDFYKIEEHLRNGGSVFITSKPSQKLPLRTFPKTRAAKRRKTVRTVTALYFDHV